MSAARRPWGWWLLAAVWLHQLAIAWLAPSSGDDWAVRIDGPAWPTMGALYHALIVDARAVHVVVTPLVIASLPLAVATLTRGRRVELRDRDDGLLLLLIASLLWLTVPHYGLVCALHAAAALQLVPVTLAAWYVIGFVAAIRAPRPAAWHAVALAAAGVIAADSARPIAATVIVACAVIAARRGAWRVGAAALAGLVVGAAIALPPDLGRAFALFVDRGLDGNLRDLAGHLRVPGWVASGVAAIWVARALVGTRADRAPAPLPAEDARRMLELAGIAIVPAAVALVTTDLTRFQLVATGAAAAALLAIPLLHVAVGRARVALIAAAVVAQLNAAWGSLNALWLVHGDEADRLALLAAAAPGSIAKVPPLRIWRGSLSSAGDDFRASPLRDRVATELFGLRGIQLEPPVFGTQPPPPLALRTEHDGDGDGAWPSWYSVDLATARHQYATAVAAARARRARLVADGLHAPDHPDLPVLAAWTEAGWTTWWMAERGDKLDELGFMSLTPPVPVESMWWLDLARGGAERLAVGAAGRYRFRAGRAANAAIVACTRTRCALLDVIGVF